VYLVSCSHIDDTNHEHYEYELRPDDEWLDKLHVNITLTYNHKSCPTATRERISK
jgi:hypothetical protein